MVGIHGSSGAPFGFRVVEQIGPRCQNNTGGPITDVGPAGGGLYPDSPFSVTCPAGQAVSGVAGGVGEVVDSVALVCKAIGGPPTLASSSPSTLAAFQYVTLTGTNLPASGQGDVVFSQGDFQFASDFLWSASPNLVVARVPTGVLANGQASVHLKNAASTVFTNSVPVTIAATPGAPMLLTIYNAVISGVSTNTLHVGQDFMLEADGTGSAGSAVRWTQGTTTISVPTPQTQGGPTGRVGMKATVPAGVTPGSWTVTVTQGSSAPSNGIVVNVVP